MRLYEGIKDGDRRYYAGGQEATKAVGGKRAPDHEVAAIDTEALPTKALLIAALNGENWIKERTVLHSKGETVVITAAPQAVKAAGAPVAAPADEAPLHPSDFPAGVQGAFWAVLQSLRRRKPGETLEGWDLASMELALERCAGCCGVAEIGPERKAALQAEYDAYIQTIDDADPVNKEQP